MTPTLSKAAVRRDLRARKLQGVHPPYYYHIHLYMPCNQKCIMCVPDGRHPKDVVPLNKFENFVDQIRPYAEHVTLIGGETLLYPWISDAIDLLEESGLAVTISTNATMLTPPLIEQLLRLSQLNLRCSIDAASRETYFKIRGTDRFDLVTANMKAFRRMSEDSSAHRQILVYVVMRKNLHEVVPFVDLASEIGADAIEFHPVRHVVDWQVENGTGWHFNGAEQSCEFFSAEYNQAMGQALEKSNTLNLDCEITRLS